MIKRANHSLMRLDVQAPSSGIAQRESCSSSSIAIVIGPTPPGTGVSRPGALGHGRIDVADEPLGRPVDPDVDHRRALLDHRRRVTIPGTPTAATITSARDVSAARSRVREWQIVTVACRCSRSSAAGLPTMSLRPITTAFAPFELDAVFVEEREHAERRPRHVRRRAREEQPGVDGMEAVDVLDRIDGADHAALVDLRRQRQLDEDAVDRVVGVQLRDEVEQLGSVVSSGRRRSRASIPTSSVALCFIRM